MYTDRNKGSVLVEFSIATAIISILLLPVLRYSGSLMKLKKTEKGGYKNEIMEFERVSKMEYDGIVLRGMEDRERDVNFSQILIRGLGMEREREGIMVEDGRGEFRRIRIDPAGISSCIYGEKL